MLWALGYPEQARAMMVQGRQWAERLGHPFSTALSLNWSAVLHRLCRDEAGARRIADACIALSSEHGFPQWRLRCRSSAVGAWCWGRGATTGSARCGKD